jgi:hypothetical protein
MSESAKVQQRMERFVIQSALELQLPILPLVHQPVWQLALGQENRD